MSDCNIRSTDMPTDAEEIKRLRKRFETHLETYRLDTMENSERQVRQELAHEQNMKAIAELTKATQGVVDAWKTANSFQRFVKWLGGFSLIGVAISWFTGFNPFK